MNYFYYGNINYGVGVKVRISHFLVVVCVTVVYLNAVFMPSVYYFIVINCFGYGAVRDMVVDMVSVVISTEHGIYERIIRTHYVVYRNFTATD